jgi:dolichol-phosphate mannosyltransferase
MIVGHRARRRDRWSKRRASIIANTVRRRLLRDDTPDTGCGLKLFPRALFLDLPWFDHMHRFLPALVLREGGMVRSVPVNHRPRQHGRSRYGIERYLRAFLDLLTVSFIERYRYRPLHLFGNLGLILGAVGGTILAYLTALKIGGAGIGQRPLLLLGVLLVVVGIQLLSLGLVGEMLTSQNEARTSSGERLRFYVRDVLD